MALTESDLSDLLAALKAGELTDTIRRRLEWILQQLIEAEATGQLPTQVRLVEMPGPVTATSTTAGRRARSTGHRPGCGPGWRSRRGCVDDLAVLLAQPGHELHCVELAGAAAVEADTGEVIDARARPRVRGPHPRAPRRHRRRRRQPRPRPSRTGPRRARRAGRPPDGRPRSRGTQPTPGRHDGAGPNSRDPSDPQRHPAHRRRPPRPRPPSLRVGHDRHLLPLPAGTPSVLDNLNEQQRRATRARVTDPFTL